MVAASATGSLLVGDVDGAMLLTLVGFLHRQRVGGMNGREVADAAVKRSVSERGVEGRKVERIVLLWFTHTLKSSVRLQGSMLGLET